MCGNNTEQCIPLPWICDGDKDCENGNDESEDLCKGIGQCGAHFTTSSGLFTSPDYPDGYKPQRGCVYKISQPSGTFLNLSFPVFDLHLFGPLHDILEIRDGISESAPLIGKFVGNNIPKFIVTTKNQAWLR